MAIHLFKLIKERLSSTLCINLGITDDNIKKNADELFSELNNIPHHKDEDYYWDNIRTIMSSRIPQSIEDNCEGSELMFEYTILAYMQDGGKVDWLFLCKYTENMVSLFTFQDYLKNTKYIWKIE